MHVAIRALILVAAILIWAGIAVLHAQTISVNPASLPTLSGDCTSSGNVLTCTKTNNVGFAASATTDTTNAANITSGALPATRMPALTGDVTSSAGTAATTVAKISAVTVSGATGTGNVVFSASPTLTGTVTAPAVAAPSGNLTLSAPSNGLVIVTNFADTSYQFATPATGATVTIADNQDSAVIKPAGTLTTLTIQLPTCSAAFDGKQTRFSSTQIVTTVTITATAGSVVDAISSLAVGGSAMYMCRGADTSWYRMQ